MILNYQDFIKENENSELKKILLKYDNIIGNSNVSFNRAIQIYTKNGFRVTLTTNIKNPYRSQFMSGADFDKEYTIVFQKVKNVYKNLIKDIENFLSKNYKDIETEFLIDDSSSGDISHWAEIQIEAK